MADTIVDRRRIVQRGTDGTGKETLKITDWSVVTFSNSGEMIEPVSTDVGLSSFSDAGFPNHGFVILGIGDRATNPVSRSNINTLNI